MPADHATPAPPAEEEWSEEAYKRRLLAERDRLLRQREALDNQLLGWSKAIAIVEACEGDNSDA